MKVYGEEIIVQCAECRFCNIFSNNGINFYYICEAAKIKYRAFDECWEIDCNQFKIRSKPPDVFTLSDSAKWDIIIVSYPPFAHRRLNNDF